MSEVRHRPASGKSPGGKHLSVRIEGAVLVRLDALLPSLSTPWYRAKRSDAIRFILAAGLPIVEAQHATTKRPRKPRGGAR